MPIANSPTKLENACKDALGDASSAFSEMFEKAITARAIFQGYGSIDKIYDLLPTDKNFFAEINLSGQPSAVAALGFPEKSASKLTKIAFQLGEENVS